MTAKDYIKGFIDRDELLSHHFSGILVEGGTRELKDGEEYELVIKMKHRKEPND